MLALRNVSKVLGGRAVLDGIDLDAAAGEVVVVRGENGSGKSTLLRVIAGIVPVDGGDISVAGRSLRRQPSEVKARLGYVPDGLEALPDLRASELVALVRGLKGLPREAPDSERLWRERFGFGQIAARRVHALSLGQRRRVALIAALAGWPELLLLDEPSSGLDPGAVGLLLELIESRRSAGCTHVVTTNDPELERALGGTSYQLSAGRWASPAPHAE